MRICHEYLASLVTKLIGTYKVVDEIQVHVVYSIIHDCGSNVLARESEGPGFFDIQVQSRFTARLTRVFLKNGHSIPINFSGRRACEFHIRLFIQCRDQMKMR